MELRDGRLLFCIFSFVKFDPEIGSLVVDTIYSAVEEPSTEVYLVFYDGFRFSFEGIGSVKFYNLLMVGLLTFLRTLTGEAVTKLFLFE